MSSIEIDEIKFACTKEMYLSDRLCLKTGQYVIIKKIENEYYISIDFGEFERYSERIICNILYLGLLRDYI